MISIRNFKRYTDVTWFLLKYGQLDLIEKINSDVELPSEVKKLREQEVKKGDIVNDLEKLGPFFIKLGQIFSTQVQLLSPEYEEELQKLQDNATPMPFEEVEKIIKSELGYEIKDIFSRFDEKPLSAASLGQVHYAELKSGRPVAVKVQRANIQQDVLDDLEIFEKISSYLEKNTDWGYKHHVTEKFQNLRKIILDELDYIKEANNLKILHDNLKEFEKIIIPLPIDTYTTARVLTMDYIPSDKIITLSPLEKQERDTRELASVLFKAYLKQILLDGFFHMDPHPGNIYMTRYDNQDYLVIFDLGMVGRLPQQLQGQLSRCLLALSEGKELEVVRQMILMGKKLENFDEYYLKIKIGDLISNYRGLTLSQMSVGRILLNIARTASEANLWLPIQFSIIGKTLLSINPVIKALDPHFEPAKELRDNASRFLIQRLRQRFTQETLFMSLAETTDFLQHLPSRLGQFLDTYAAGEHTIHLNFSNAQKFSDSLQKIANRIMTGLILASLVVSAALLMSINTPFKLFGYPGFAMILFILAALGALWLILTILWNDYKSR